VHSVRALEQMKPCWRQHAISMRCRSGSSVIFAHCQDQLADSTVRTGRLESHVEVEAGAHSSLGAHRGRGRRALRWLTADPYPSPSRDIGFNGQPFAYAEQQRMGKMALPLLSVRVQRRGGTVVQFRLMPFFRRGELGVGDSGEESALWSAFTI